VIDAADRCDKSHAAAEKEPHDRRLTAGIPLARVQARRRRPGPAGHSAKLVAPTFQRELVLTDTKAQLESAIADQRRRLNATPECSFPITLAFRERDRCDGAIAHDRVIDPAGTDQRTTGILPLRPDDHYSPPRIMLRRRRRLCGDGGRRKRNHQQKRCRNPGLTTAHARGCYHRLRAQLATHGWGFCAYTGSVSLDLSAAVERIHDLIAAKAPRREVLTRLATAAESAYGPGAVASILVLDEQGLLRNGASPNLPTDYLAAIDRLKPNPKVGTCAAAAATGNSVMTPSFLADEKWAELRHLPLALGFAGAWSMPIKSVSGRVLGTFGTYFRDIREPSSKERKVVETLVPLAALAIEKTV